MMFVSGETCEPSAETAGMVEEIVRGQIIEMLQKCSSIASRRGSRSLSTQDLIFLMSHDIGKASRLRTYLSWKYVRKSARDNDPSLGAEVHDSGDHPDDPVGPTTMGQKRVRTALPWGIASSFSEQFDETEEGEDEDAVEENAATLQRLRNADERTRGMTRDQYVHWSRCRQASFTYRKGKRFRDWVGIRTITDATLDDDIIDILGFLAFEIVQTLTEEALEVKRLEHKVSLGAREESKKRKRGNLWFSAEEQRTPIEQRHIVEAFRRLQSPKPKWRAMKNLSAGVFKSKLTLV
ncbi:unnamed protein product [Tuber melanosporum]|uniref:(Perigord truffle) hypothetical protein n=1 Tax=Tuber melanosporum (strain Mel28) TaxID=656061 RepID=D5GK63_TUBMM|nr:uncharacterized protein GSTUM_00009389001 [Tuber melanosporum]CAZ84906.1 unnamed protein product [Tuber melanosporum]